MNSRSSILQINQRKKYATFSIKDGGHFYQSISSDDDDERTCIKIKINRMQQVRVFAKGTRREIQKHQNVGIGSYNFQI